MSNVERIRLLLVLHATLERSTTSAIDTSDILRSCHVLVVSALDHYIHDIVRRGMLEIFDGRRPSTPTYERFRVTLRILGAASTVEAVRRSLEEEIVSQHSFLSFQQPDRIADAIRHISSIELWNAIATAMNEEKQDLKNRVQLIVDRRNKIAHEADLDPTFPNTRWPIGPTDVEGSLKFIERLVGTIDGLVSQ